MVSSGVFHIVNFLDWYTDCWEIKGFLCPRVLMWQLGKPFPVLRMKTSLDSILTKKTNRL
ncbi:hypothetical protein OS493_000408 [Desmophyllum pertusum]|nr:hypothetical protein OS493_000408 [Desmophyllum pertusum]